MSAGSPPRPTLREVVSRRTVLRGLAAGAAISAMPRLARARGTTGDEGAERSFDFEPVTLEVADSHRVAKGYRSDVLVRWGDPILPGAPKFDLGKQSPRAQAGQFGHWNDYVTFMPLPLGSGNSSHGLLCVNHEHATGRMMFPGVATRGSPGENEMAIEMEAVGHSVVEVRRSASGRWRVVRSSRYGRRTTATTPIEIRGPVRGHRRVRTAQDPAGTRVLGTFANCSGGKTPWGTVLSAEENYEQYFAGTPAQAGPERRNHERYGIGMSPKGPTFKWHKLDARFHVGAEPREANRFGWIVEIDPYDPSRTPVKRTALGRLKHESAAVTLDADGRVVVYSGDDQEFEYLYRFVSHGRYEPGRREANLDLLDSGTLSVARFEPSGRCHWMPLVFGSGPLTPRNGFRDQGDVLIEARRAADLLGPTALDRPEDIAVDEKTGRVYVLLTGNPARTPSRVDKANPRAFNLSGHVLEIRTKKSAGGHHHAGLTNRWEVFSLGGKPEEGLPHNPDNAEFDPKGRLWIATDQGKGQHLRGVADALWAFETSGPRRGRGTPFFACPRAAEMCGPAFTPDGRTLFLAVQHPGAYGETPGQPRPTVDTPTTRWPDFKPGMPPRCSIVAITRPDGGVIGG